MSSIFKGHYKNSSKQHDDNITSFFFFFFKLNISSTSGTWVGQALGPALLKDQASCIMYLFYSVPLPQQQQKKVRKQNTEKGSRLAGELDILPTWHRMPSRPHFSHSAPRSQGRPLLMPGTQHGSVTPG